MKRLLFTLPLCCLLSTVPSMAQGAGSSFGGGFNNGSLGIQNRNALQPFRAFYPRVFSNSSNPWLPPAPTPTYPVSPSNPAPGAYYPSNPSALFNPYNPPSPLPPYQSTYPPVPAILSSGTGTTGTTGGGGGGGLTASFANTTPATGNIGQFNPSGQSTPLSP